MLSFSIKLKYIVALNIIVIKKDNIVCIILINAIMYFNII